MPARRIDFGLRASTTVDGEQGAPMLKWLRTLKRRWRQARGQRIFRKLCRTRSPLERGRLKVRLQQVVVPPDRLGWSRFYLEIIRALSEEDSLTRVPEHLDETFNWFFKEFAVTYPGMIPNNLPPNELSLFAVKVARKACLAGPCGAACRR